MKSILSQNTYIFKFSFYGGESLFGNDCQSPKKFFGKWADIIGQEETDLWIQNVQNYGCGNIHDSKIHQKLSKQFNDEELDNWPDIHF